MCGGRTATARRCGWSRTSQPSALKPHPSTSAIYQIFFVHYSGDVSTVANLTVTIGVGTPNPITRVITRTSEEGSPTTGINAALVDVRSGVISEHSGTRVTAAALEQFVRKP
jgi:hypothetical protein